MFAQSVYILRTRELNYAENVIFNVIHQPRVLEKDIIILMDIREFALGIIPMAIKMDSF